MPGRVFLGTNVPILNAPATGRNGVMNFTRLASNHAQRVTQWSLPRRIVAAFLWLLLTIPACCLPTNAADSPPDFTDAPIYEIGEIPFQTVWHGQETKFRVRATALGAGTAVSAGYVNPPSGTIYFDSGNFFYRPGVDDKAEFTVTFTAAVGASRLEQIVPVQPIPLLPPEGDLLGVERKGVPDPTSRDYLVISDLKDASNTQFNHGLRKLRTVTISGKEVILRAGHANRLFESYEGNEDIREFHINAEKLVVASPFRLPSTKVVIRARQLEFQDIGGQVSHISTQPADHTITPSQTTTAGGTGLTAGDMEVYLESLTVPPFPGTPPARFVTRGGSGQNGAPGLDGAPGPNYKRIDPDHFTAIALREGFPSSAVRNSTTGFALDSNRDGEFDVYTSVLVGDASAEIRRANNISRSVVNSRWVSGSEWRPDGANAKPGGVPGNGGSAGRIKSNLPTVLDLGDVLGGNPGTTPGYTGGAAGSPSTSYFFIATDALAYDAFGNFLGERRVFTLAATHIAKAGQDAPPKLGIVGAAATKDTVSTPMAWLTPQALRQVVNHVNAAYLEGEPEFVHRVATEYLALVEQLRASPDWASVHPDRQRDYGLMEEELGLLAHRSVSGLDYFGNPPGWVPLLSLEANKLAFEQEVERAIGILYLEYWLSNAGVALQGKIGALADARKQLAAESEKLARDFDTANTLLPNLETRVETLETETVAIQNALKFLEADLLREAKDNLKVPLWRRIARGLGSVCKLVPVPWVQAVGVGLDVVANFNVDKPWDSIEGVVDVVKAYRDGDFDDKAKALNASYKKIKFPELPDSADPHSIKGFVDDLQKASKPIVDKLKGVQKAFQGNQAPRSQIEAELAKLKAESKEFKQLGDRISALMGEKELFAQQVSQTIQLLGGLSENITGNLLAMDALNEGYAQAAGALDDRALMYLKEIGRRARERLLLYHYYVKKAYEYRLLRPYPGRLDLQKLFDRFRTLAENSGGTYQQLTGEQFRELRGLYDDALGELIKEVVVEYNQNAPALSAPRRLALTPEELTELNQGREIRLDLRTVSGSGLFPKSEENLRIANIRVHRLTIEPPTSPQAGDEVSLYIEHSGASTLHTTANNRARSYRFVHYTEDSEVPVQWGARYFPNGGDLVPISRSLSADSLLGALLQKSGTNPRDAGYFTYLGGLAELRLKREQTAAPGTTLRLNEVVLEIEYEFVRRGSSLRSLEVTTADELAPYLEVSTPDLGGRQDGLGSFERTYSSGTQITLSAPDRIGNLRFAGFVDLSEGTAPNAVRHGGPVTIQRGARPVARQALADFDGSMHRITLSMATDRRIEARYLTVEELQLSISGGPTPGGVKLTLDGERYTPFRLETAPAVQGPWLPVLEGTLIAPEERLLPTSGGDGQFYRLTPR
jgi:hypothetical protein